MKARSVKCHSCGKQHVPGFAFCQRCGAPLSPDLDHEAVVASPVASAEIGAAEFDDLDVVLLALLGRGKKSQAIRVYRETTGADLNEATTAIEQLVQQVEFGDVPPRSAKQTAPSGRAGCAGGALLLLVALAALIFHSL